MRAKRSAGATIADMKLHYMCSLPILTLGCLSALAQPYAEGINSPNQRRSELRSSVRQLQNGAAAVQSNKGDPGHRLSAQERSQLRVQLARGPRSQTENGRP